MDNIVDLRDVAVALAGPPGPEDADLIESIQQQLILILHTLKCQQSDYDNELEEDEDEDNRCTWQYCHDMRTVIDHMIFCQEARACTVRHCSTTVQIILHYKRCDTTECHICCPFKVNEPKEWHESITNEERAELVELLLQAIASSPDSVILGKGVIDQVWYTKKTENDLYKQADSLIDYYRMMAEKIRAIEMENEEKNNQLGNEI